MPGHGHGHHEHIAGENRRRLTVVLVLTTVYLIAEVIGGVLTNSLALLSDAGHMLTDVAALVLALIALWFALRPATPRKTYGYYRLEILAALFNGLTLLAISVVVIVEAVARLHHPPEVHGLGMLVVAFGGLVVNIIGAYLLQHGHAHSLNIRAAFYHMLGDLVGSLGAVVAGVLILTLNWRLADPIIAIGIAVLIIISAIQLVREAVDVLLEATPRHIDIEALRTAICAIDGVGEVHDLHIWTLTSGMYALSCHVVVDAPNFTVPKLEEIRFFLHEQYEILHLTIQLETCELTVEEEIHL